MLIDAERPDATDPDCPPLSVVSRPLGIQTNNVAEYTALLLALEEAHRLGASEIDLRLDSMLIVEQLHGRWRVKDAKLRPLWEEARRLLAGFARWSASHEPRATNRAADALANLALDDPAAPPAWRRATGLIDAWRPTRGTGHRWRRRVDLRRRDLVRPQPVRRRARTAAGARRSSNAARIGPEGSKAAVLESDEPARWPDGRGRRGDPSFEESPSTTTQGSG